MSDDALHSPPWHRTAAQRAAWRSGAIAVPPGWLDATEVERWSHRLGGMGIPTGQPKRDEHWRTKVAGWDISSESFMEPDEDGSWMGGHFAHRDADGRDWLRRSPYGLDDRWEHWHHRALTALAMLATGVRIERAPATPRALPAGLTAPQRAVLLAKPGREAPRARLVRAGRARG